MTISWSHISSHRCAWIVMSLGFSFWLILYSLILVIRMIKIRLFVSLWISIVTCIIKAICWDSQWWLFDKVILSLIEILGQSSIWWLTFFLYLLHSVKNWLSVRFSHVLLRFLWDITLIIIVMSNWGYHEVVTTWESLKVKII